MMKHDDLLKKAVDLKSRPQARHDGIAQLCRNEHITSLIAELWIERESVEAALASPDGTADQRSYWSGYLSHILKLEAKLKSVTNSV